MKYRSDCFKKISPSYILFLLFFLWHRSISESDKTCFHFQNCLSTTAFRFHLFSVHKSNPFTLSCIHIILYFITFAFLLDFGITQYLLPEGGGVGGRSREVFLRGVSRGFRGNGEEISLRKGVYRKLTAMRGGEGGGASL